MEIECQGCYYTLCSFVCLTEDLSEILQFLWRHGCLRRSYFCEKCGRKCAIGDKDLFFRCNRNTISNPVTQNLSVQSNASDLVGPLQTASQIQTNESRQILPHQINQISHQLYMIHDAPTLNLPQPNRAIEGSNIENIVLINQVDKLQHSGLLSNAQTTQSDSVNLSSLQASVVNHGEEHQINRILSVVDSQGNHIIHANNQSTLLKQEDHNSSIYPLIQVQPGAKYSTESKISESKGEEPAAKVLKKSSKPEASKSGKKRCNFKVSMKKGTFFEKSKLPIDTVCKFVVFWCCMKHPTQEFLRNELSLATRTVVDWSTACREICIHWAKSVSEKIGGDGVMVQVDEVKIQDSKDSKNDSGNRFSFWGMEKDKEKGKIFIVPVPACDSWSLLTVINDWILPGSVIISNCWKAYDCLKLQEFIQQTVVQSKTFIHPQNNAGSQNFEGKVDETGTNASGELHMPRFGTRRSHHLGDLAEFMFKRRYSNHLERMHAFFKQISLALKMKPFSSLSNLSAITRMYSARKSGLQLCIVGGGPAGFYSAQQLIKLIPDITVDIYERLPVPFGLVRYGVAPDHGDVKNVINTFTKTAKCPQVNFYGNICLGETVTLNDLRNSYHAVLLTYGAEEDKKLNIPGEDLKNVISARRFVGWYNGLPRDKDLKVNLDRENVAVIGHGNVAVDIARILLSSVEKLKKTDITEFSLEQLSRSKVKSVSFIGRRGPLQIACTIKELREMLNLPGVTTVFNKDDFVGIDKIISGLGRPRKRLTELLYKSAMEGKTSNGSKTFRIIFKRTPLEFKGNNEINELKMCVNNLEGDVLEFQKAITTDQIHELPCDLALRSIGYKSVQAEPSIPFNFKEGIVTNTNGRIEPGLYCSGWLSTGPVGVILSTMTNAFSTSKLIHEDIVKKVFDVESTKPGSSFVLNIAKEKGTQIVRFEDWEKIDREEEIRGKAKGKPREKIVSIEEMLQVAS